MALFKIKNKEPEPFSADPNAMPAQASGLVDQIIGFRQQGYSDEQIVQYLQGQGVNPPEIYDALNQANPGGDAPMDPGMQQPMPPMQEAAPPAQEMPPPPIPGAMPAPQAEFSREKIEEVAEAIINEKWTDLLKDVNKIIEWKEKIDVQVAKIGQEIKDIKGNFDSLHKGMLGKITEYDENITKVGTNLKAMEMTFHKILPTLTENVNTLSDITKNAAQKKRI